MAATSNAPNLPPEDELYVEVLKRVTSSIVMQDSQDGVRGSSGTAHAFGYPFTGSSLLYGPRVNFAAKDYWAPNPPDAYAVRNDRTRNRQLRALPRGQRHTVYGDAGASYSFGLTPAGEADFFNAVTKLFIPQPPHKRALIHCDYLISLVQMRSFAATIGQAEFNRRAASYGPARLRLRWNLFNDLEFDPAGGGAPGPLASLQVVRPANEDDLIIGDHVYDWEPPHLRPPQPGDRQRLAAGEHDPDRSPSRRRRLPRPRLGADVQDPAPRQARRRVQRGRRPRPPARSPARTAATPPRARRNDHELPERAQGQRRVASAGPPSSVPRLDIELRRIHGSEVLGPYDPYNPAQMYKVRRPIESA